MQKEIGPKTAQKISYTIALRAPSRGTTTYRAGPELSQEQHQRWATYNIAQAGTKSPRLSLKGAPGCMGCGWGSQVRLLKAIMAY